MDRLSRLASMLSAFEVPSLTVRLTIASAVRRSHEWAETYWELYEIQTAWRASDPVNAVERYKKAGSVATELLAIPAAGRQAAMAREKYRKREVSLWLLEQERRVRRLDIMKARDLAETAVTVSEAIATDVGAGTPCDPLCAVESEVREILVLSLTRTANTWRVTGDYSVANALMLKANHFLGAFPSNRLLAEYEFFRGPLLMEQGDPGAGCGALETAARIYEKQLNDRHMAGACEVALAKLLWDYGESRAAALRVIESAATKLDPFRDPSLMCAADLYRSLFLAETGKIAKAELCWHTIPLLEAPKEDLQRLGVGGIIDLFAGRLQDAEEKFKEIWHGARRLGDDYLATYAMLYLAITYFDAERLSECIDLVKEVVRTYDDKDWHRQDLLAGIQLLQRAVATQTIDRGAIESLINRLTAKKPDQTSELPEQLRRPPSRQRRRGL